LALVFTLGSVPAPLIAQTALPPTLRIMAVDVRNFPDVAVHVVGDNLPGNWAELPVTIQQDGVPIETIKDDAVQPVGVQIALVFDAAGNVFRPGQTGDPLYREVGHTARNFIRLGVLSAETDWLTAISFNTERQPFTLAGWGQDHQAVVDRLYQYEPTIRDNTPLHDLLRFALKSFTDSTLPPGMERAVVIFSDGINAVGTNEVRDSVNEAGNQRVRIYPVMLGTEVPQNKENLQYLSGNTGGTYYHLTDIESLDPLWRQLAGLKQQRVLTYRSTQPKPSEVTVALALPNGSTVSASRAIPGVDVQPINIVITAPAVGTVIERRALAYDTPLDQVEPTTLDVQLAFVWPDNRPRALRSVTLEVGGQVQPVDLAALNAPIIVSIAALDSGPFSVIARAEDELGEKGESSAVGLTINVVRPPTPTPTVDPALIMSATLVATVEAQVTEAVAIAGATVTAQATAIAGAQAEVATIQILNQRLTYATAGALLFGVLMLSYAIYILSSSKRRKAVTQVITRTVSSVTEPFIRRGARAGGSAPRAHLRLENDGGTPGLPPIIPLNRAGVLLGRDPAVANTVLADRRVSRLHCRIVEDGPSGSYRIYDEGSASGTVVNDEEVGHMGRLLQPNDLLGFGPLEYRFEVLDQNNPKTQGAAPATKPYIGDDNTDPYIKTP
jgi:hypothetical protein